MAKKHETPDDAPAQVEAAPVLEPVSVDDLKAQIDQHEAAIVELRAKVSAATMQHYPKMRYHAEKEPVIVLDARSEAEAAADGYTYDGPVVPAVLKNGDA